MDDDGFQDFQANSLEEILMEHFSKVLIIVLFVFCVFVSVRFSSIYGAFHCKQTSNAGGFCVHVSLSTSGVIQAAGRRCGAYSFVCFCFFVFYVIVLF